MSSFFLNWPSGSGEDFFFNFVNVFPLFRYYLPLEKGVALFRNNDNFVEIFNFLNT